MADDTKPPTCPRCNQQPCAMTAVIAIEAGSSEIGTETIARYPVCASCANALIQENTKLVGIALKR